MTSTNSGNTELRATMGGSLRPGDARRFFIEAMVGAMHADGNVDQRELMALRGLLERHDLFAALPVDVAQMLIDLSTDAIEFAGGVERRVPVICGNLRWRLDRLAAFAMACEVSAADDVLDEREVRYLSALRTGFRLDQREHDHLLVAAKQGRAMAWLENESVRVRAHLPVLAELLVMNRWRGGEVSPDEVSDLPGLLTRLRDFAVTGPDAAGLIEDARRRSARWTSLAEQTPALLAELPFPCDRYWVMVYTLVDSRLRGHDRWVDDPLVLLMAGAFHYSELHMQLACDDAGQLISAMGN